MEHIELQRLKTTWRAESVLHPRFAGNMCSSALLSDLYASQQRQIMAEMLASNGNDYRNHLEAALLQTCVNPMQYNKRFEGEVSETGLLGLSRAPAIAAGLWGRAGGAEAGCMRSK